MWREKQEDLVGQLRKLPQGCSNGSPMEVEWPQDVLVRTGVEGLLVDKNGDWRK